MPGYSGSRIDHLNVGVSDLTRSEAFYSPTLDAIGIDKTFDIPANFDGQHPAMVGYGWPHKPFFWLVDRGTAGTAVHLAFTVDTPALVEVFFETALRHGATPKLAPMHHRYHEHYYGAFVYDPDGINLEAVCHQAPPC